MRDRNPEKALLSVSVSPQMIEAVLMRPVGENVEVLKRFIRPRAHKDRFADAKEFASVLPGVRGRQEADFSIEIGGTQGPDRGSFLATEFEGLGLKSGDGSSSPASVGKSDRALPFSAQLIDILNECTSEGYPSPDLAFQILPPDVSYVELKTGKEDEEAKEAPTAKSLKKQRRQLICQLEETREEPFEKARVAFVPMTDMASGRSRVLAIVPERAESVGATLGIVEEKRKEALSNNRVMDSEVSIYARLARKASPADRPDYTTAFVRVGGEESLVVFMTGGVLRHYERLRSLSSYDAPDTICSRILLQQDEQKLGNVDHIIVVTEGQTDELIEAFKDFYPQAAVESAADAMKEMKLQPPAETDVKFTPGSVPAIALGMRLLQRWDEEMPELDVHLLPRTMRRKRRMAFGWHTGVVLAVLFAATFFFTWRYMANEDAITERKLEMERNPVVLPVDNPEALRMRVDSLRNAYLTYSNALHVLDSLLVGSDKWSRTLEWTSDATGDVGSVWFTDFSPQGNQMWIEGEALVRNRVATLARRLDGRIERLDFADVTVPDIGDVRVYPFTMVVPIEHDTPAVAVYLQEQAAAQAAAETQAETPVTAAGLYAPDDEEASGEASNQ